jgi:hypothetical protein
VMWCVIDGDGNSPTTTIIQHAYGTAVLIYLIIINHWLDSGRVVASREHASCRLRDVCPYIEASWHASEPNHQTPGIQSTTVRANVPALCNIYKHQNKLASPSPRCERSQVAGEGASSRLWFLPCPGSS